MNRKSKADKRKDKLKERRRKEDSSMQALAEQLSLALEELCAPILPEYTDDSKGIDLVGRKIVYQFGLIAWNIALSGQSNLEVILQQYTSLNDEERQAVREEIIQLVASKHAHWGAWRHKMQSFSLRLSNGKAVIRVLPGEYVPQLRPDEKAVSVQSERNNTKPIIQEEPMKHSFYDVKARQKVTAEVTDFISYGEGKTQRFAFRAKTKDGRNLTAFVSKPDWDKAKKK